MDSSLIIGKNERADGNNGENVISEAGRLSKSI
jgi:hypothetical protein